VSEVTVLHRCYAVFLPVSLVFAVRVIKIWNHKNLKLKPTVNRQFLFKKRLKPTANPKMETVTALIDGKNRS